MLNWQTSEGSSFAWMCRPSRIVYRRWEAWHYDRIETQLGVCCTGIGRVAGRGEGGQLLGDDDYHVHGRPGREYVDHQFLVYRRVHLSGDNNHPRDVRGHCVDRIADASSRYGHRCDNAK